MITAALKTLFSPLIFQEAAANTPFAQNKQECTFSEILATPVHIVLLSLLLTDDVLCNTNRFLFNLVTVATFPAGSLDAPVMCEIQVNSSISTASASRLQA